jgi:hypothetical protein
MSDGEENMKERKKERKKFRKKLQEKSFFEQQVKKEGLIKGLQNTRYNYNNTENLFF